MSSDHLREEATANSGALDLEFLLWLASRLHVSSSADLDLLADMHYRCCVCARMGLSMLSEIACRPVMVTHREEATTGEEKEQLGALASQLTALREGLGASTIFTPRSLFLDTLPPQRDLPVSIHTTTWWGSHEWCLHGGLQTQIQWRR